MPAPAPRPLPDPLPESEADRQSAAEAEAGRGIPVADIRRWVESWDTPAELSMPVARPLR